MTLYGVLRTPIPTIPLRRARYCLSTSCPALCRASTSSGRCSTKDVDGRDEPCHDGGGGRAWGRLTRGGFGGFGFVREQRNQRALDRGLARRRTDLRAHQVRDVEHVDHALAERRNVRGCDIEIELRERRRQLVQKPCAVEPGDLDHRVAVRPLIVDGDGWLYGKGADAALRRRALGHDVRQSQLAAQRFLD